MRSSLVLTLAVLALLAASARGLAALLARSRTDHAAVIEPWLAPGLSVAALTIEYPRSSQTFVCAPSKGRWRSYTAFGAPLVDGAVPGLVARLAEARGTLRASAEPAHASYGLGEPRYRIVLHGPGIFEREDEDVLDALEIGAVVEGPAGAGAVCFARRPGSAEVWELAFDPRAELERPAGSSMPPMLDERIVPGPAAGRPESSFRYIEVDGRFGAYRLARRELEPSERTPGAPAWAWTLQTAGGAEPCSLVRAETYSAFLRLAPYVGLEDPKKAAELGFSSPALVLRAWPIAEGDPVELYLGDAAPRVAGRFCLNLADKLVCVVSDEVAAALDPDPALFTDEALPEPWTVWLERALE